MRDLKVIIILIVLAIFVLAPVALASSVPVVQIPSNIPKAQPGNTSHVIEVHQGGPDTPEIIYWNETVNLELVQGWYGIVERYPGEEMVDVSSFTRKVLVEPVIFPTGTWYQWSADGKLFDHGNNIAFEVRAGTRPVANVTYANVTGNETAITPMEEEESLPLTRVHVADYYIARGDPVNVTFENQTAQVWVIQARNDGGLGWLPPVIAGNYTEFSGYDTGRLQTGANYSILIQDLGQNGVADLVYRNITRTRSDGHMDDVIISPLNPSNETIVSGLQPWMVRDKFMQMLSEGFWVDQGLGRTNLFDDNITERSMVLEVPSAEIREIYEIPSRGNETLDATIIRATGYTNLQYGAEIRIVLDINRTTSRTIEDSSWTTTVIGKKIGDKRQFTVSVPLYFREIGPGEHFLTAITPQGIETTVSFHVYDIPEGQVAPEATHRYVGGNEWVPTPTPKVIEKFVEVPKVEYVYVTPEPTPTPEPAPFYTQPPWSFVIGAILAFIVAGLLGWALWKWG
jgi:hypothetical protein